MIAPVFPPIPPIPPTTKPPTATRMGVEYCLECNHILLYCGCRPTPADAPPSDGTISDLGRRIKASKGRP